LALSFLANSNPEISKLESIVQQSQKQAQAQVQIQNQSQSQNQSNEQQRLSLLKEHMGARGHTIDSLLTDSRFLIHRDIANYFTNSSEKKAKTLDEYKKLHKFEEKKDTIPYFIERNFSSLKEAEQTYGIPKEIIAAIFGIESSFAKGSGRFNPFNAYVSMHVKGIRSDLAIPQLVELLKFCRKNSINVFDLKSSYAGAISYAQFIPSSLNRLFIGDDLYSLDNNIMSVANYLSHFKKITGSLEKSIYRYNNHPFYVGFVMELAKEAEKALAGSQ